MRDNERIREICRIASKKTTDGFVKSWFIRDEFGGWEKSIGDMIENTEAKRLKLGLTIAEANEEIATMALLTALEARARDLEKRGSRGRRRRG